MSSYNLNMYFKLIYLTKISGSFEHTCSVQQIQLCLAPNILHFISNVQQNHIMILCCEPFANSITYMKSLCLLQYTEFWNIANEIWVKRAIFQTMSALAFIDDSVNISAAYALAYINSSGEQSVVYETMWNCQLHEKKFPLPFLQKQIHSSP